MAPVEERAYLRSQCAVFFRTREAFGDLSNMSSRFPLKVNGVTIRSSEALYQACRYPHLPEVQQKIIEQTSPMTAKMVGKPYRTKSRADWDDLRVRIMKWCLRVKLIQHWKEFRDVLLSTGDRHIVEQSTKDPFWGAIPDHSGQKLIGANVLGRLLMELRDALREQTEAPDVVDPLPIRSFLLLDKPIGVVARSCGGTRVDDMSLFSTLERASPLVQHVPMKVGPKQPFQLAMFGYTPPKVTNAEPKLGNYHLVSSKNGGWDLLREGGKRITGHFDTKAKAVERGHELAAKNKVDFVQHTKNGDTARRSSYGEQQFLLHSL